MVHEVDPFRRSLAQEFAQRYPVEAAVELERLTPKQAAGFFEGASAGPASSVLALLTPDFSRRVLKEIDERIAGALLARLGSSDAARLISRLQAPLRDRLLDFQEKPRASELRELLSYPPQTAGSLMDPEVLALRPELTAVEALKHLRKFRAKRIHRLFLVDPDQRLVGSVRLRDLAVAEPSTTLGQLILHGPPGLPVTATREAVVEALAKAQTATLPVVDFDGRLLGVIRHDKLVQAAREEATVDMQSMVGAGKEERALSKASLAVRKRLPWLQVNLGTAFLAASVVGLFEGTIARHTALAVLLPVVAGQSGNTGAQALAVTMRGLALREIRTSHWLRVVVKEGQVGFFNGIAVALTTALGVWLWSRSLGMAAGDRSLDGHLDGRGRALRGNDPDDLDRAETGPGAVILDHPDHRDGCGRLLQLPRNRDAADESTVSVDRSAG